MPGVSNGTFLPLRPPPPLPGIGWRVLVYAHSDLLAYARGRNPTPLAAISRFQSLTISPEVSDVGAGSITLDRHDPIFRYPLADGRPPTNIADYQNLYVVFQDGQWRGEFLAQSVVWNQVAETTSEGSGQTVTISGPGPAQTLNWARVMTPQYPKATPPGTIAAWRFVNQPMLPSWAQLLFAAQRRGTIPFVRPLFTAGKDSAGRAWQDASAVKPANYDRATVGGNVTFASGDNGTQPSQALRDACTALAKKLAAVKAPRITVTGHTDDREGTDRDSRRQLALDRASAVANLMQAAKPLAQITTAGKGQSQPVASNRTRAGRARNRRVVVTYQKNPGFADSVWIPERGTKLLDLLQGVTSGSTTAENRGGVHYEWLMRRRLGLEVRQKIGTDRSATVQYHEGSTYVADETFSYDRADIANLVAVWSVNSGKYAIRSSPAGIGRWLQREAYTELTGTWAAAAQARIAATTLASTREQAISATITVQPGYGRVPLRDYDVGDVIGLVRLQRYPTLSRVDKHRVMAISITVDVNQNATYQLTLESAQAGRYKYLQAQLEALRNRRRGLTAFIQDGEPVGGNVGDFWTPEPIFRSQ